MGQNLILLEAATLEAQRNVRSFSALTGMKQTIETSTVKYFCKSQERVERRK